jgi:hypothetical protein
VLKQPENHPCATPDWEKLISLQRPASKEPFNTGRISGSLLNTSGKEFIGLHHEQL